MQSPKIGHSTEWRGASPRQTCDGRSSVARKIADALGWLDTFDAEYVALTQLQADAFVTLDRRLARAVTELVMVAPIEELY